MATGQRSKLFFAVEVKSIFPGEFICVCGSIPELGEWIPSKAFKLSQCENVE